MFDFRRTKSKLLMEPWEKKIQLKLEMSMLDGTQPPIYTTFFFVSFLAPKNGKPKITFLRHPYIWGCGWKLGFT